MESHVLGFPRIGERRELKRELERYWNGKTDAKQLLAFAEALQERRWRQQVSAGLSLITTGDFSLYDHVLDTVFMLGLIPPRFHRKNGAESDIDLYFRMARGDVANNIPAMEMTKWFDTNYHYIVPEFTPGMTVKRNSSRLVEEVNRAHVLGMRIKPVLIGPITLLCLGKEYEGINRWDYLDEVVQVYCDVLHECASLCEWIQIDEPILCTELPEIARDVFPSVYKDLKAAAGDAKILLATYFGSLRENADVCIEAGCDGLHLDLVRGCEHLDDVFEKLPSSMIVSAGIVDGRNIWKNDFRASLALLDGIEKRIGRDRMMVGTSCSLLHVPVDLSLEKKLDAELKRWMSFAVQKCAEVKVLAQALSGNDVSQEFRHNAEDHSSRANSMRVHSKEVQKRTAAVSAAMLVRGLPYAERKPLQQAWLRLPLLPTTTIGSFPQTTEIREARRRFKDGQMNEADYEGFLKDEIRTTIRRQEELGLDVLVHGESERNDMVEYFGQQMNGFCFSENGWVQSYGSRCVKPPIIFGDISRPEPMTVKWIQYAQSLTNKPVKGMLTGPVTMLNWSFVRDDLSRAAICKQIALAIRDEVLDLETAGVRIIQVDEAALREGMPLRREDAENYLRWAVDSFRLAVSGVAHDTQIHTHMCYSEFNSIIFWIAEMDADVISIESSRSDMKLLQAFKEFQYPNEIGPGVYDIHSPRVPSKDEIVQLIRKALQVVPADRLWINPDCGLKTRQWPETLASLQNMMSATLSVRQQLTEHMGDHRACKA